MYTQYIFIYYFNTSKIPTMNLVWHSLEVEIQRFDYWGFFFLNICECFFDSSMQL